ncbi:MAG: M24 family metallopeptidase [Nocardioides sp.]|uniref:M24 family metallopeptidase n=1 Tax=Nocardioides sp. TaxID=35761 RepID=UPI0039E6080D
MIHAPLGPEVFEERRRDLADRIAVLGLDAAVVCAAPATLGPTVDSPGQMRFLFGWTPPLSPAVGVVRADGASAVVAGLPHDARTLRERTGQEVDVVGVPYGAESFAAAVARLVPPRPTRVAVAGLSEATASLARHVAPVGTSPADLAGLLFAMRAERSAEHEPLARAAAHVSDAMVRAALDAATAGTTLAEIMSIAEATGRRLGAESASCWLSGGARTDTTLYEVGDLDWTLDRSPGVGDRLQIGTTVRYDGFYGQTLRTAVVDEPPPALETHAELLREIQSEVAEALRPGAELAAVGRLVRRLVDEACPYAPGDDPFRFQACHGLGLSYSEPALRAVASPPELSAGGGRKDTVLVAPGMVVEVHPNYSVPGLGLVCIGDMVLVTDDGPAWLTRLPRTLDRLPS